MLDLTAAFSELYQVRLFDGTELNLKRPTQALQESIMRLQEMGEDVKNSAKIMKETMAIFCRVLNRNTQGITFTQEQLEDDYDYSVALLVIGDYLQFYAKEVAAKVSFRTTQ